MQNVKSAIPLSDWASLTCSLIWIYADRVPVYGNHRPGIVNQESAVWLVREGEAHVKTKEQEWVIRPGEWFFLPEISYWQDFAPETHLLSLRFRATWITGIPLFHHGNGVKVLAEQYPILESEALPINAYFKEQGLDDGRRLRGVSVTMGQYMKLQSMLMNWVEQYVKVLVEEGLMPTRLNPIDPRMLKIARELNNWPLDLPLDEEILARGLNLSGRQLARLFSRDFGMTPSRYFSIRKLDSAKSALQTHDVTIKEIASSHGFKSLSHFSTWFRSQFGESPRSFRKTFFEYHPTQR